MTRPKHSVHLTVRNTKSDSKYKLLNILQLLSQKQMDQIPIMLCNTIRGNNKELRKIQIS